MSYALLYLILSYVLNFGLIKIICIPSLSCFDPKYDSKAIGYIMVFSPVTIWVDLWIIGCLIYDNALICWFIKKYFGVLDKYIGKLGQWICGGQK